MLQCDEIEVGNHASVRKNSSDVWKEFLPLRYVSTKTNIPRWFYCVNCSTPIENTYGDGTTTIFLRHLKNKCNARAKGQPKIDEFIAIRKPIKLKEKDKSLLMEGAMRFVVDDLRPFRAIECSGLFDLLSATLRIGQLYPNFQRADLQDELPSGLTLRRNVDKTAVDVKSIMKSKIREAMNISGSIACTSDTWTDDFKQRTYISITCHINLVTESCISHERLEIALTEIEEDVKSSDVIKRYIFSTLNEYGLTDEEISGNIYFVTDRGSNFKAIVAIDRFNCKAHMLGNVTKEMCTEGRVAEIISNADHLIKYVKKSGLNSKDGISVKTKCPTRFNTVYISLGSIVNSWEAMYRCLEKRQASGNPRFKNCLSKIECLKKSTLMKIVAFLKPFKEWTDSIEGDKDVTIVHVWPTFVKLNQHLRMTISDEFEDDPDFQLIEEMKTIGRNYITRIINDITPRTEERMAMVLHPRMKRLQKMAPYERDQIYKKIDEIVNDGVSEAEPIKQTNEIATTFLDEFIDSDESMVDTTYSNEFQKYLNHQVAAENFDLRKWWFQNKSQYPNLFKMFLKLSCIPASSAPSERTFSTAGLIITDRRSQLLPKSVENLIICRNLYRRT